ncbi:MAG: DNA primase [Spirochaetaceae bacterium]|jgi:DNA primase|nr:DNA primase [Spirochaetaceae bacterium]
MAGRISQETIQDIAGRVDMVALVGEYTRLEKKGGRWAGLCPFHNEKTPSFFVDPLKKLYHCFGCGAGGDAISFYREVEKASYVDAVRFLAQKTGVEIRYDGAFVPVEGNTKNDEYRDLYTKVAGVFHHLLVKTPQGAEALAYIKGRGITDETVGRFMLGYAPRDRYWLRKFLTGKSYSREFLSDSGLFSKKFPDMAFFQDRLMFPIYDRQSRAVAFGGRILSGDGPKYLNSGDLPFFHKGETLYAFNLAKQEIRSKKAAVLCEGYMDVLAYHQSGVGTAVAPLGTALTREQVRLVKNFADTVYLSFDSDRAGEAACRKAILLCRQEGLPARVVRFNEGKDPAEILQKFGPQVLTKCIESAIIDSDYLLSMVMRDYPIDTPEGKTKAALAFFPYIDALAEDMQKQSCLDVLCQALNIRQEAARHDYLNRDEARKRTKDEQAASQQAPPGRIKLNAELRTVLSVIANFEFFPEFRAALSAEDFENSLARDMFISMEECYRQEAVSVSAILSRFEDKNVKELITDAVTSGEYGGYTLDTVKSSIKRIKRNSFERRRTVLQNKISGIHVLTLQDQQRLDALLSEKMSIDSELKNL